MSKSMTRFAAVIAAALALAIGGAGTALASHGAHDPAGHHHGEHHHHGHHHHVHHHHSHGADDGPNHQ
jgi:hypothetical protein